MVPSPPGRSFLLRGCGMAMAGTFWCLPAVEIRVILLRRQHNHADVNGVTHPCESTQDRWSEISERLLKVSKAQVHKSLFTYRDVFAFTGASSILSSWFAALLDASQCALWYASPSQVVFAAVCDATEPLFNVLVDVLLQSLDNVLPSKSSPSSRFFDLRALCFERGCTRAMR